MHSGSFIETYPNQLRLTDLLDPPLVTFIRRHHGWRIPWTIWHSEVHRTVSTTALTDIITRTTRDALSMDRQEATRITLSPRMDKEEAVQVETALPGRRVEFQCPQFPLRPQPLLPCRLPTT